jgi:hypothetical protein
MLNVGLDRPLVNVLNRKGTQEKEEDDSSTKRFPVESSTTVIQVFYKIN